MKSLKSESESLFKDRGSKFFAYASPINKAEEIKEILERIREIHPKARHFCYAFRLKINDEDYFITNDDGEPSNSAGAPILGAIKSYELYNVCIIVVRYFGGTKLGVSGLINAYKTAAKDAIENNKIISLKNLKTLVFSCDYQNLGSAITFLNQNQIDHEIKQEAKVMITILAEYSMIDQIKGALERLGTFSKT